MGADGYKKQRETNAHKVEAAGGVLIPLFLNHPMMTNEMRTTVYTAKVRSLALLGADIWGWRRAYEIDKSECKALRILTRSHNRTKLEAMLWLTGLYPLWVPAAVQAFNFLISILEHGDEMERAAWEHWKMCCRLQARGWVFDLVSLLNRIGLLDRIGGCDAVLRWTVVDAKHWFPLFREHCEKFAEQEMLRTLSSGKYTFLIHAIPTFKSPRPHILSLGEKPGYSLYNFLLSAHSLEVETGRFIRQERGQRMCQACRRASGISALGDEAHTLSSCIRASERRQLAYTSVLGYFPENSLCDLQHGSLYELVHLLHIIPKPGQNEIAGVTPAVEQDIRNELATQDCIPNRWREFQMNMLVKSVAQAAERYFRKCIRKQQRNMPQLPSSSPATIVLSDDSDDVEILN